MNDVKVKIKETTKICDVMQSWNNRFSIQPAKKQALSTFLPPENPPSAINQRHYVTDAVIKVRPLTSPNDAIPHLNFNIQ